MNMAGSFTPEAYYSLEDDSTGRCLLPRIFQRVSAAAPKTILDYGCGNGRLWRNPGHHDFELMLFDPMIDDLRKTLGHIPVPFSIATSTADLPGNHFDVIVCSLVLMAVHSDDEAAKLLETIQKCLKASGRLVLALTHPCFIHQAHPDFVTSFSQKDGFSYNQAGNQYKVIINDRGTEVSLTDTHRNLNAYLDLIKQAGLTLTDMEEITCENSKGEALDYPSFLILEAGVSEPI